MAKNKEPEVKEAKTFSSIGKDTKVPFRLKVSLQQLEDLDEGKSITAKFRGINLEIKKAE
jgi:hypothetical protein